MKHECPNFIFRLPTTTTAPNNHYSSFARSLRCYRSLPNSSLIINSVFQSKLRTLGSDRQFTVRLSHSKASPELQATTTNMSNIQHQSLAPAQHALNSVCPHNELMNFEIRKLIAHALQDSQSAEQSRYPKSTTTVTSYHAIQALSLLQSDQSRTYPGMSSAAVFQLQAATSPEDITTWYGSPQLLTEPALRAHIGPLLGHTTTISAPEQQKSVTTTTGDVNIDPAIAQQQQMQGNISQPHTPQQMQMSVSPVLQQVPMEGQHQQSQSQPHSGNEGESGETPKKGGKRELSTSKRAAQNRAAQVSLCLILSRISMLTLCSAHSASEKKVTSRSLKSKLETSKRCKNPINKSRLRIINSATTSFLFSQGSSKFKAKMLSLHLQLLLSTRLHSLCSTPISSSKLSHNNNNNLNSPHPWFLNSNSSSSSRFLHQWRPWASLRIFLLARSALMMIAIQPFFRASPKRQRIQLR